MRGSQQVSRPCEGPPDGAVLDAPPAAPEAGVETLLRTHVVPLVSRHHRTPRSVPKRGQAKPFTDREIARFCDHAIAGNTRALTDIIALAQQMDVALEDIWLGLLQPAARALGKRWATDSCDFATVTLAMCHFHSILRRYSPLFVSLPNQQAHPHRVLLVPAANEQHTFGLVMLGEFLRRVGSDVTFGPFEGRTGLMAAVRGNWFTLVGFSLSCNAGLDQLAAQIVSVRRASRNPAVVVLAGGRVFNEHPELVSRVGADWTARDAREAVDLMRGLARPAEA